MEILYSNDIFSVAYTNGMITINETLVVILVSFLIFVMILNRLMFRPLNDTIRKREGHLNELDSDIKTAQKKATDLMAQLKEKEASARQEGQTLKSELETVANDQAKDVVDTARKTITDLKENTQNEVKAQVATAKKTIQHDAEQLSLEIMTKILGRGVS